MSNRLLFLCLMAMISALTMVGKTNHQTDATPKLRPDNIEEVLNVMTLEEKAQLLVGGGKEGFVGSGAMLGYQKELVAGAAGITVAIPRLGIPATVLCDGPAGVHIDATRDGDSQTYYATGFPIGTCLASTWNTELVEQVGQAIGNETHEYGCDVILGPGLNLHRNPLCGRNFEYYSEDPVVTGLIGAAMVKGIQSQGVGVSIKHFAVNSQETARTKVDERVSQRALRELYLKGFEMTVRRSAPWTVMSSYNKVNGVYAQGNKELLSTILRDEWGFQGIVMTDWIGKRTDLPVRQEVQAGNDLMMPGYAAQAQDIVADVQAGLLDIKDVDRCVRRMLEYIVKTPHFKQYAYSKPDLKSHAAVTRQSATEGMVLLRNEKVLPFANDIETVALFGVNSYDFFSGGLGSGCVNVPYVVNMLQGLEHVGIKTTSQLTAIYQNYINYARLKLKADKNPMMWFLDAGQPKLDEIEISERCIAHDVREADAAIITIGRQAGEGMDRKINGEFNLSQIEQDMIFRVSSQFHAAGKPVVVIINSGSVMETCLWRDRVDAILCVWQPGEEGGNSVADVLTGRATPSGKLTMTWPIAATDHPSTKNYPQDTDMYTYRERKVQGRDIPNEDYTNHEEDIYVGYRYFDTFCREVAYPFGFGLSYTTFAFSKPTVKTDGDVIRVSITVRNTGSVSGKEVAQVYVSAPQNQLMKPVQELKAFAKTRTLQPGESQTLTMQIQKRDMASFDETASQWLVEPGTYTFRIGSSSRDIHATTTAEISKYTEKVHDVMAPRQPLKLLKP